VVFLIHAETVMEWLITIGTTSTIRIEFDLAISENSPWMSQPACHTITAIVCRVKLNHGLTDTWLTDTWFNGS